MPRTRPIIEAEIEFIKARNPHWVTDFKIIALITAPTQEKNLLQSKRSLDLVSIQSPIQFISRGLFS